MKRLNIAAVILAAILPALSAAPVDAKPKGHCPPGLAKKAVPCVPPGQAKKGVRSDRYDDHYYYRRGDYYRYDDRHVRLHDYDRYRLPRLREGEAYYRDGNVVYRVNRETQRVLDMIRLAEIILGN